MLRQGETEILSQRYDPPTEGYIAVNLRDVIHGRLSFLFEDSSNIYQQFSLVDDFTAIVDDTEIKFRVIRSGVDRLADSATNFLTQNFLTWQPSIKPVTYYSPEFLTYYAVVPCTAKLRAYFTDDAGVITSQTDYTITDLLPGIAYTIPLQYSVVAGWLGHKLPAYYDVWIENTTGQRLTYIQRYYAEDMRSEQEQWILFENSLGGLDTFRAYGNTTFNGEHTHNLAEIDEISQEYRVDTERKFQKNTGHLNNDERKWLLDFFPSKGKYCYTGNYLRPIVVVESNVSYTDKELPSNYTFTFKYADARPLLNLPRTDVPADVLNITVPSVGSFTVPPRLAEFPRLPLSEGALFPIQNPYSEEWSTTTIDAICYFLAELLSQVYGSGGGIGHQHRNFDLLQLLSHIEGYLLVNGQKIKAGYADKAGSVDGMDDIFIHKNKPDGTPHTLTIGKDLKFGDFISMLQGGYIDKFGDAELRRLILRESLSVPEIRFNRMTYFEGYNVISPGGGFLIKEVVDNGDGTYTITPDREEGEPVGQFIDDILTGYWHNFSDGVGEIKGFGKVQFRVSSVDYEAKTAVLTPKPDTNAVPKSQMRLAQTGNFTNEERQTYIVIDTRDGNSCITFYDHANTWDVEPAQEMSWLGKKKGRTVHGIPADNYSAVLRNVIMSGKIFQVDDITGEAFRVPLNKGAWVKDVKNAYYDEVTHNGSSWLCVNPVGTTSEPTDTNADWLKCVAKGADGAPGTGISATDVEYAIYESSEIAPPTGWQTTSPAWVDGKFIWSRTKITYTNGTVKYTNAACITGGKGATGGEGKGIKSIVEQYYLSSSATTTTGGNWQTTSPAWKNGWYIWTRSVITYTDNTTLTTNAICVTGGKGADGTSITNCGDWHTGLHVPYMGMTKMYGRIFLCKKEGGTDNPPMWTITDKDGNRILQTQDGGKTYGYIITGELNTAEYELLVENGKDGRDGKDHEWIFKHTTENVAPSTPGTSQVDDYVPSGWRDDAIGVSETLPYEWACARTKKDGVWSSFTPSALWAKWGFDGESVVMADFDNEMVNASLNSNGITTSAQSWITVVTMSYGAEKLALDSITCAPGTGLTCMTNKATGEVTVAVSSGVALRDTNTVNITVRATKNGQQYTRSLVFTVAGVRGGANGADAVLYSIVPSVSSVKKDKSGNYSVPSVSCKRVKTVGGVITDTTDGELKYSINGGAEISIANNAGVSSASFSQSLKFIYYVGGKVVDVETVPMLIDGNDGTGISSTDVEYAISTSNSSAPTAGWQTTSPAWVDGKFIWSRTKITYTDKTVKYTNAACITGGKGATGGEGKGIKSIVEQYYLSSSATTTTGGNWQTTSPAWKNGWYIWTRSVITYTDNTTTTTSAICVTGGTGNDGQSITSGGQWRTPASPIPALTIVTMGNSSWLSKVATLNPPLWVITDNNGNRILQTQDGGQTYGYILTGEVNTAEWEKLTEDGMVVYLVSTTSNIRVSNAGSLVPSAFKVYAKRNVGSTTLSYSDGYLAARGYSNGIWSSIAAPTRSSELTVNASSGYSTFSVRCYKSQADAAAWNDSFVAEQSVGVSYDGGTGRTGSEPRPRGMFAAGNSYVWNEQFHDIVLATFNNRTVPFRVRAYGATVTIAPNSIDGDTNWEPAQQFQFVATDLLLSRQIRADEIYAKGLIIEDGLIYNKLKEIKITQTTLLDIEEYQNFKITTIDYTAAYLNLPLDVKYDGAGLTILHNNIGGEVAALIIRSSPETKISNEFIYDGMDRTTSLTQLCLL